MSSLSSNHSFNCPCLPTEGVTSLSAHPGDLVAELFVDAEDIGGGNRAGEEIPDEFLVVGHGRLRGPTRPTSRRELQSVRRAW